MHKNQDDWEKLVNITEEYEPNPDLADRVIDKLNRRENAVKFKKPRKLWLGLAASLAVCAIALIVFLPIFFNNAEIIYYSENDISYASVEDMNKFVEENNLDCKYYSTGLVTSQVAYIQESNQFAYINQKMTYIDENGFDFVDLKIVLLDNAQFSFYGKFEELNNTSVVSDISVSYLIEGLNNNVTLLVKFDYDNLSYYMEIETVDGGIEKIEQYVTLLLK